MTTSNGCINEIMGNKGREKSKLKARVIRFKSSNHFKRMKLIGGG